MTTCRVVPVRRRGVVRRGSPSPTMFPHGCVRAVSPRRQERVLLSSAGTSLAILDVLPDGRALIATHVARMGCSCLAPGQTAASRALMARWFGARGALCEMAKSLLLSELLRGAGKNGSIYLRKTDGSDAIRLGDGYGEDLSPDGKWVLTTAGRSRGSTGSCCQPGRDRRRLCPPARSWGGARPTFYQMACRSSSVAERRSAAARIYLQDIDSGSIRPISPEKVANRPALLRRTAGMSSAELRSRRSSMRSTAAHRYRCPT